MHDLHYERVHRQLSACKFELVTVRALHCSTVGCNRQVHGPKLGLLTQVTKIAAVI